MSDMPKHDGCADGCADGRAVHTVHALYMGGKRDRPRDKQNNMICFS